MKQTDIFERAEDWNARGDKLRLRPGEWMLMESIDGYHTIGELLEAGEWDIPSTEAALERLEKLGLIQRVEYSWEEYCHRFREDEEEGENGGQSAPAAAPAVVAAADGAAEAALTPEPLVVAAAPPEIVPEDKPSPEPDPEAAIGTLVDYRPAPPEVAPAPALDALVAEAAAPAPALDALVAEAAAPGPEPEMAPDEVPPEPVVSAEPLPLRQVLDFVMDRAGGGPKGQLAVYRTFLKIPMHQLRESGIKSLNLATSDLQISDPALKESLLNAVQAVVGEPYAPMEVSLAGS